MESKYLNFHEWPQDHIQKRKTRAFTVESKNSGAALGLIRWYGQWRQYCFFPAPETLFNVGCMTDISDFIRQLMEERKAKKPNAAP